MKSAIIILLAFVFIGCPNPAAPEYWDDAVVDVDRIERENIEVMLSPEAGIYSQPVHLELSTTMEGATIYYTIDGSVPDPDNVKSDTAWKNEDVETRTRTYIYSEAIDVQKHAQELPELYAIQTANRPPPYAGAPEVVVVRAVGVDPESRKYTQTSTHSYLFTDSMHSGLPIISLSTDRGNFFDYQTGIYVRGKVDDDKGDVWEDLNPDDRPHYRPANYHQRGRNHVRLHGVTAENAGSGKVTLSAPEHGFELDFRYRRTVPQVTITGTQHYDGIYYLQPESTSDALVIKAPHKSETFGIRAVVYSDWERPVQLEFFEPDGQRSLQQGIGVRIHGSASRTGAQKQLRLYARGEYDARSEMYYRFFPNADTDIFKRILLRRTTERSGLEDIVGQHLMQAFEPNMDIQRYRPALVYLNGEFWGIYSIRDRYDNYYFSFKYDIEPDESALVVGYDPNYRQSGRLREGDYDDLLAYQRLRDTVYEKNLADSHYFEVLQGQLDIHEFTVWMATGIFLNYSDWGNKHSQFWRYTGSVELEGKLDGRWRPTPIDLDGTFDRSGWGVGYDYLAAVAGSGAYFLGDMFANEQYRIQFIQTFTMLLNTVLNEDFGEEFITGIAGNLPRPLVTASLERWGNRTDYDHWYSEVDRFIKYMRNRPMYIRQHLQDYFEEATGTADVYITGLAADSEIILHTVHLHRDTPGVHIQDGTWSGTLFTGVPVTLKSGTTDLTDVSIQGEHKVLSQDDYSLTLRVADSENEITIEVP